MTTLQILKEQTKYLTSVLQEIYESNDLENKLEILEKQEETLLFLKKDHPIAHIYPNLTDLEKVAVSSITTIGQGENIFRISNHLSDTSSRFKTLLEDLLLFETFYKEIGGIIGYHLEMIKLICDKEEALDLSQTKKIYQAQGISLQEDRLESDKAVIEGIKSLPLMGEIYPIGGAGDRLNLTDEKTGLPLPTAKLNYLGQSLLTCMIKDLQAREFIYYKLFNKQLLTPIAMMTSEAKNNHQFVQQICDANFWHHRPKESYKLFKQPLAPVLTTEGRWSLSDHLQLFLKPSGHGVIWKLAKDEQVFEWFQNQKRPKALVRQMNNPIAGTDNGIFALIGLGCKGNKAFGFASCHRLLHAAEGVNVLTEQKKEGGIHYGITNIEYTEFDKYDLKDVPNNPNSPYSIFPSNTNILFIDLYEIEKALQKCSIPGMLINMKSDVPIIDEEGNKRLVKGGRLESTMQNIADYMTDSFNSFQNIEEKMNLRTFLTYNVRRKTISVAKKTYEGGSSINETPEGCYYSLMQNNFELLSKYCEFELPPLPSTQVFLKEGPSLHFLFHPSLGPLFSIIGQKIQKGRVKAFSELVLKISELEIYNLNLSGSLIIETESSMGHLDESNYLVYSNRSGKCTLINTTIENKGIQKDKENIFWKNHLKREEKCQIYLEENAEFFAKNVVLRGDYDIHVPKNTRMIASQNVQGNVTFEQFSIKEPTWHWKYEIDSQNRIKISKQTSRK